MHLSGTVASGLGRAQKFMAQPHYQDQFRTMLGRTAWPGTLNVHVHGDDLVRYMALRQRAGLDTLDADDLLREQARNVDVAGIEAHRVRGFLRDGVSFGGATAFLGRISVVNEEGVSCAVLIPDLTRHVDVVEIIADVFLREALQVQDGDTVFLALD
jgi:CTP-dependent riboflavin kinase